MNTHHDELSLDQKMKLLDVQIEREGLLMQAEKELLRQFNREWKEKAEIKELPEKTNAHETQVIVQEQEPGKEKTMNVYQVVIALNPINNPMLERDKWLMPEVIAGDPVQALNKISAVMFATIKNADRLKSMNLMPNEISIKINEIND